MAQKVHLPNFSSLPGCRLLALAEPRSDLAARIARRYEIPRVYPSHLELIADPEIEAIGVSAGYSLQGRIARDALLAGKHVFMEKPMATSLAQADELLAAEAAGGGRLMVAYMKRYDAGNECAWRAVRELRESGELGPLLYARNHGFGGDWVAGLDFPLEKSVEPPPPAPTLAPEWLPAERIPQYLGYLQQYTHNVNLLRWFLDAGDDAQVRTVDLDDDGYSGVVTLRLGGVRATLETGSVSHYAWDEHTQLYFRHGWVRVASPPLLLRGQAAEVEIYRAGEQQTVTRPLPAPRWSWSYKREAEHFLACVASGEPFRSSARDTRTDVRLFEEIYSFWLRGRTEE